MPKTTPQEPEVLETSAPEEITLDEFCARLSKTDKRVELIAAFHFNERSGGHAKDTEDQFASRFEAFATKPV